MTNMEFHQLRTQHEQNPCSTSLCRYCEERKIREENQGEEIINCILTIPPSANSQWRIANNRIFKTQEAWQWQEAAAWEIKLSSKGQKIPFAKIRVTMDVFFPDNRNRDIDNLLKLTGDAIQESGIVKNDADIWEWNVKKNLDREKPRMELEILEYVIQNKTGGE